MQPRIIKRSSKTVLYKSKTPTRADGFFLTQVDSPTPQQSLPRISHTPVHERLGKKLSGLSTMRQHRIEKRLINRYRSKSTRKELKFLKRTNGFEEEEEERNKQLLLTDIRKELKDCKKPCIGEILNTVLNKESIYSHYMDFGRKHHCKSTVPEILFSKEVISRNSSPIPVLSHIKNKELILKRYNLHDPLCYALSESFPRYLETLSLDNCGVSDVGGAALLAGLSSLESIRNFNYSHNLVGPKMLQEFSRLLTSQIKSLNLNGCRTSGKVTVQLIEKIYAIRSLETIAISNLGLNDQAMAFACKLLRRRNLQELDLSWNQISLEASSAFFSRLARNRYLRFLDYSWNKLAGLSPLIGKAIKKSKALMHLNLTNTQISDDEMIQLTEYIKKSVSLIGLHFSDMSLQAFEKFKNKVPALETVSYIENSGVNCAIPFKDRSINLSNKSIKQKRLQKYFPDSFTYVSGNCTQRVLSRNLEEPNLYGGTAWYLSDRCYICEKWSYFKLNVEISELEPVYKNLSDESKYYIKGSFNDWNELDLNLEDNSKLSICLLMPPGIHKLWISSPSDLCISKRIFSSKLESLKINEINIPRRTTPINLATSQMKPKERKFVKEKSVFSGFIEDNDARRKLMFENDKKYFKLGRMIKKKDDLLDTCGLLLEQYPEIKEIFDYYAALSNYPTITMLDFSKFCEETMIMDSNHINTATIDRLFIATNFEVESLDENPDRELCRYEFLEIIVRIATTKYQDLGLSVSKATQKLMDEHIVKYAKCSKAFNFRRQKIYLLEVNDILEYNIKNIQTLFFRYKTKAGKWLTLNSVYLMIKEAGIHISEKELVKCFSFSKMSVLDENNSGGAYHKLLFVEFLEFLGRVANSVFVEEAEVYVKLELLLEKLFSAHKLYFRRRAQQDNKDDSESD